MVQINVSEFEWLSLLAQGHSAFQFLFNGSQLGVFEKLSENTTMSISEMMESLDLQENPTRILLTGLTALRLLEKLNDGKYRNTEMANRYLVRKSPENMIDVLGWQRFIVYPGVQEATASIQKNENLGLQSFEGEGNTLYQKISKNEFLRGVFQ